MTPTRTHKKTTCTFICQGVAFHVHCDGLGCHVVIGVGRLVVRFHHAYAIPSFLLDVAVRLYLVIVHSDCSHNYCLLHIAKTGHLRWSLQQPHVRFHGVNLEAEPCPTRRRGICHATCEEFSQQHRRDTETKPREITAILAHSK